MIGGVVNVESVTMVEVPAGRIVLRDEGTRTNWQVDVAGFRLAAQPVTCELYAALRATASAAGPRTPVVDVCWIEAVEFCNLLSVASGFEPCYAVGEDPEWLDVVCDQAADGFRLPTEAEWEYACRAGSTEVRYGELDDIAWYRDNSGERIHDVGTRTPNAWGLHDMIGNVWEWCWDLFDPDVYGAYRVFRGGGWCDPPRGCRASCRRKSHPTYRMDDVGFRLARSG
jgi:formylglycine-generating enzyme required for sulfatase activity